MQTDNQDYLIGTVEDLENPVSPIVRERQTSRMIAYNDLGKIAILELKGKDEYNLTREHFETPGGKLEPNETPESAVIREASEELGAAVEILNKIGIVIDINYFTKAKTISHYFEVNITGYSDKNWTNVEKRLIHQIRWFTLEEAIKRYENLKTVGMGTHIHTRDLLALRKLDSSSNM